MSREARRELGDLLASQLDAIEADMRARTLTYKQAAEYRRRVEITEAKLHDMPCTCQVVEVGMVGHLSTFECDRCYLLRVVQGDE